MSASTNTNVSGAGITNSFGNVYVTSNYTGNINNAGVTFVNPTSSVLTVTPVTSMGSFSISQTGTAGRLSIATSPENLFLQSGNLASGNWNGGFYTAAAAPGVPDAFGTATTWQLTCTQNSGSFFQQSNVFTDTAPHVFALWVKGNGSTIGKVINVGNYNNGNRQYTSVVLSSSWQYITVAVRQDNASGNALYIDLNDSSGANLVNTDSFYVCAMHCFIGNKKAYVQTAGSVVNGAYDVIGQTTVTKGNTLYFNLDPNNNWVSSTLTTTGTDPGFLLIRTGPRKPESIVIAAADTVNPYDSDYVCTGYGDDAIISSAIASLGGVAGKVKLRAGTFLLTAPIIHDVSWVTLEGEARPFWSTFNGAYPTLSSEGIPGGSKLKMLTDNKELITVNATGGRHAGIGFKNLYFYGRGNQIGIHDVNATDVSEITDCMFHNLLTAIDIAWDTPFISGNNIQSCLNHGIVHRFVFGTITKNIVYDIGGSAVQLLGSGGTQVVGNTFGSLGYTTQTSAIYASGGKSHSIIGNTIHGISTGCPAVVELNNTTLSQIVGNTMSVDNIVGLPVSTNLTAHGIYLHNGSASCAITGNTINNTSTSASGYAVKLGATADTSSTSNTVVANVISGSKWNGASATTVLDNSGGSTNKISLNSGDSH